MKQVKIIKPKILCPTGVKQFKFCILFSIYGENGRKVGSSFPLRQAVAKSSRAPGSQEVTRKAIHKPSWKTDWCPMKSQSSGLSAEGSGNRYKVQEVSLGSQTGTSLFLDHLLHQPSAHHWHGPQSPGQGEKGPHTAAPSPQPTGCLGPSGFQAGHLFHSRAAQLLQKMSPPTARKLLGLACVV